MFVLKGKMKAKYFIAVVPPANVSERIEEIKLELFSEHKLKGALRSPAHITLHRPFEWKEEKEDELIQKLREFEPRRRFKINLKDFACFQPRVIYVNVLKSAELSDTYYLLRGFARRELNLFNESEDERGFSPHVTVAFRDLKKQLFYKLWDDYKSRKFEAEFDFSGICLLKLRDKWEILMNFDIPSLSK